MKIHGLPIIFARDVYEAADLTMDRDNALLRTMTAEEYKLVAHELESKAMELKLKLEMAEKEAAKTILVQKEIPDRPKRLQKGH